jgi:mRNA interferase RelE/StbE
MDVAYEVEFEPQVAKQLRDMQRADLQRVMDRVKALADDPRPQGSEKLAGMANAWRIRSGNYRVVYTVDDRAQVVTVTRVGHRREVYRRR